MTGSETITADEYNALPKPKQNKYGARRTERGFASQAEERRYDELCRMEHEGIISALECQPRFPLTVNGMSIGTYIADFRYLDRELGVITTEDVKGVRTPVYRLKKKLVRALYGIEIQEVTA